MELRSTLVVAVVCALVVLGHAAPAPAPEPDPKKDVMPEAAEAAVPAENTNAAKVSHPDGLTPVVIPEHVHLVDKRSPHHKKFGYGGGGYGGYGGGGYGGGGCNVCGGGGGGGYPHGGGGYGGGGYGGGSYSQSSSSSQSSSGSWGKK